jgi:hypothetical protein
VYVTDRAGDPVAGLSVTLSGPKALSDVTNANGCILWGYLPAGGGYTISFSKSGYVTADGGPGGGAAAVVGEMTTNVNYLYDRGGSISTNFKVKDRLTGLPTIDTKPKVVSVDNSTGTGFAKTYDIGTTSSLNTPLGLLFPFTNPYAVYADSCGSAKPLTPDAPTSATVTPGGSIQAADTVLPALDVLVTSNATKIAATVRVITACGSVYQRTTAAATGRLADPGFPYGAGITICATNGTRKRVVTGATNKIFTAAGTPYAMDIATSGSTSTLPNACP